MSAETFEKALDFLARSGIEEARLLGGEPTLHPEFQRLAEMALRRGLRLRVFSNGRMPKAALEWLESQPEERVAVLINFAPDDPPPAETLRRLGKRVTLGLNLHTPTVDPSFLPGAVREYGVAPRVRLGLAHPMAEGGNRFLDPRHYRAVGRRVADFFEAAREAGVEASFDCGFVPCMFPRGFLEAMGTAAGDIGTQCSPVLDILPDGKVVPCYPLAALAREPLPDGETADALRARFTERFSSYRRLGVFRECTVCEVRENGGCNGGCLAASMQRLRTAPGPGGARASRQVPRGRS
jgi:radical SAM protein with 4Fe4S-binding SPASM domain